MASIMSTSENRDNANEPKISENLTVDEMLRLYPETIAVLLRFDLHCVGCPISRHHTLAQVARDNGISLETLLEALQQAVVVS